LRFRVNQAKETISVLLKGDFRITKLYTIWSQFWLKGIAAKTEFQVNRTKSFKKISFGKTICLSLQTYYIKHSTSLCSISIIKSGHLSLPNFLLYFWKKNQKHRKTTKTQKNMFLMYLHHLQHLFQKKKETCI